MKVRVLSCLPVYSELVTGSCISVWKYEVSECAVSRFPRGTGKRSFDRSEGWGLIADTILLPKGLKVDGRGLVQRNEEAQGLLKTTTFCKKQQKRSEQSEQSSWSARLSLTLEAQARA